MIRFCPACGENVETYTVDKPNRKEVCCIHCGMIVEGLDAKEISAGNTAIIADDSPMIREMLKDVFISGSLADEVIGCKDGYDFISTFIGKKIRKKKPFPSLSLTWPCLF